MVPRAKVGLSGDGKGPDPAHSPPRAHPPEPGWRGKLPSASSRWVVSTTPERSRHCPQRQAPQQSIPKPHRIGAAQAARVRRHRVAAHGRGSGITAFGSSPIASHHAASASATPRRHTAWHSASDCCGVRPFGGGITAWCRRWAGCRDGGCVPTFCRQSARCPWGRWTTAPHPRCPRCWRLAARGSAPF